MTGGQLSSCGEGAPLQLRWGRGLFLNNCGLSGGLLHMRNAGSSGVSVGACLLLLRWAPFYFQVLLFSCGGLLSSGGRVQLSYCGKGLQASYVVHGAF